MLDFQSIVEEVLAPVEAPDPSEYAQIPCEDRWVVPGGVGWDYRPIPDKRDHPAVLLILESPHIQEFRRDADGNFVAVGPAAGFEHGETGYRISQFLEEKYLSRIEHHCRDTPVYLVNAIQYQCSLNQPLTKAIKKRRDKIFIGAWEKGGKEDFIERLSTYYRNGDDIIINACTGTRKQRDSENLKMYVEKAVISALSGRDGRKPFSIEWKYDRTVISDLGTYHPSSLCFKRLEPVWQRPINREPTR